MQERTKNQTDVSNHYRIWFSNNKEQFLPPIHQVTIEESIINNPNVQTTLIVSTTFLSECEKQKLIAWGESINCVIKNIDDIEIADKNDAIILEIVKQELNYWANPPHTGNPGIASDYLRLLFIDKGLYLDCDIFVYENVPLLLETISGCFLGKQDQLNEVNNNKMAFSSTIGKRMATQIKETFITNYFFDRIHPSQIKFENVSSMVFQAAKLRSTQLAQFNNTKLKGSTMFQVENVLKLGGPDALKKWVAGISGNKEWKNLNLNPSSWLNEDYDQYFLVNANSSFTSEKKPEMTWISENDINGIRYENINIMEDRKSKYRNFLKSRNLERLAPIHNFKLT